MRHVELLFARLDALERQIRAAAKAYDLLMPALLQKAFRGELVPQDPNDEPASVLPERIRAARGAASTGTGKRGRKAGKPKDAAQASAAAEPERRGRLSKASAQTQVGSIPTVSSFEEAVRQLEAQGKADGRIQGQEAGAYA